MAICGQASFGQMEIWSDAQVFTDDPVHNLLWEVQLQTRCEAETLADRLSCALTQLTQRHDGLRSFFTPSHGGVYSCLVPPQPIVLTLDNVIGWPQTERQKADIEFGLVPFDLLRGPLFRFRLEHTKTNQYRLLCAFHHMVIDGATWRVFLSDLRDAMGQNSLAPRPRQYQDFCDSQRQHLKGKAIGSSIAYWRQKITSPAATWELSGKKPANRTHNAHAGVVRSVLAEPVQQRLLDNANALGTSPFRLAFAAFGEWASRMSRQKEITTATTLAGHSDDTFAGVIGLFGTVHHIDTVRNSKTTFLERTQSVSAQIDASIPHQTVSLKMAMNADNTLSERRTTYVAPPVAFTRLPTAQSFEVDGIRLDDRRLFLPVANRDLSVYFQHIGGAVELTWVYKAVLFDRATVLRWTRQLEHILDQALLRPNQRLSAIEVAPPQERDEILRLAVGPHSTAPIDMPLHRLIERQAHKTPDAIAVVCGEQQLSYSEIDTKANHLAQEIGNFGVKKGDFVPTLMPSSGELLLTELALLKLGAVFVPLDPDWPKLRVLALLDQLDAKVTVTRAEECSALKYLMNSSVLELPPQHDIPERYEGPDNGDIAANDPVYCIFTSGSTGQPKGAINTNQGLVNRIHFMLDQFAKGFDPVILACASTVADTLVWQYFFPLICGGRCVISHPKTMLSPDQTAAICAKERVTLLDYTPVAFNGIASRAERDPTFGCELASVRSILIGGEAMQSGPVNSFGKRFPSISIYNSYGPTEAAISAVFHKIDGEVSAPVPIGRPLPNVTAIVLDELGHLAPIGQTGELCLGGACVGLGYFGDTDKTDKSFVTLDLAGLGNGRFYRTGDAALLGPDGMLVMLGRIDDQISLNGNRIEPGDVEAALMTHPAIVEAAAVLRESAGKPPQLAVLVVAVQGAELTAAELRDYLADRVPQNMLPGAYFSTSALPRKPSGKLDRLAATNCKGAIQLHLRQEIRRPLSDLENTIIDTWKTVLMHGDVEVQDDFFLDLAGDSLSALKCHLLLEERIGRDVNLQDIFRFSTPASLAQAMLHVQETHTSQPPLTRFEAIQSKLRPLLTTWQGEQTHPESLLFTLNGTGASKHLFWCFQGFNELRQLAIQLGPDHPVTGMRSGHLVFDYAPLDVDALAKQYALEINAIAPVGELTIGGNCQATIIVRQVVRQLRQKGRVVDLTILMEDTVFTPNPGPTALLFGADSHLNPYTNGSDPKALFQDLYPGGFTTHFIPGSHGTYFGDQNILGLSSVIRELLG